MPPCVTGGTPLCGGAFGRSGWRSKFIHQTSPIRRDGKNNLMFRIGDRVRYADKTGSPGFRRLTDSGGTVVNVTLTRVVVRWDKYNGPLRGVPYMAKSLRFENDARASL